MMQQRLVPVDVDGRTVYRHGYVDLGPGRYRPDLESGGAPPTGSAPRRRPVRRPQVAGVHAGSESQTGDRRLRVVPADEGDLEAAA